MFERADGDKWQCDDKAKAGVTIPQEPSPAFFIGFFKDGLKVLSQPPIVPALRSPLSDQANKFF